MNNKLKLSNIGKNQVVLSKDREEISVTLIGPVGVGKSALLVKYITRRFIGDYDPTYEGCWSKCELIDGCETLIHIYDTYDKDRKNLDKYLKWSDYLILVYNITNYQSFLSAQEYLDSISELLKYYSNLNMDNSESITIPVRILLLGNKLDLERFRQVPKIEVETFIEKYSSSNKYLLIKYMESTSCDDYEVVQGVFMRIIRDLRNENRLLCLPQNTRRAKSPGIISNITNTSHNVFGHSNTLPNIQVNKETNNNSKKNQSKFQFFNKVFK